MQRASLSCASAWSLSANAYTHGMVVAETTLFMTQCCIRHGRYGKLNKGNTRVFLRYFRDPIWVPRIENRVPRIRGNYHQVPRIRENRVSRIREIRSLQVHTWYITFSLKKNW